MPSFDERLFEQLLLFGLRVNYSDNIENYFYLLFVVIYVFLNVKPRKKCMYFRVPRIAYPILSFLCINRTTNGFVPAVQKGFLILCFQKEQAHFVRPC